VIYPTISHCPKEDQTQFEELRFFWKGMYVSKAQNRKSRKQDKGYRRFLTRRWGIALIAVVAVIVLIMANRSNLLNDREVAGIPDNSVEYAIQAATHIEADGSHVAYNSDPPTSGAHSASIKTDVYHRQFDDEALVHNLEHGHIWYSYRDADDEETIAVLSELQSQNPRFVIVTHRPENDSRVAAAAWGRLLTLEEPDIEQLRAFSIRYANNAPENVAG
jgi:hypothetical protein